MMKREYEKEQKSKVSDNNDEQSIQPDIRLDKTIRLVI